MDETNIPNTNETTSPNMNETTLPELEATPFPDLSEKMKNLAVTGDLVVRSMDTIKTDLGKSRDIQIDPTSRLPYMPNELVNHVALYLDDPEDLFNMRLVNQRFYVAGHEAFSQAIGNCQVIYPRYDCIKKFLSLINLKYVLPSHVRKITLVSEGLREHEYGYGWAWEYYADVHRWTQSDMDIMHYVDDAHANDLALNGTFLLSGRYRSMLTTLFRMLKSLRVIEIRPLRPGEHNPYWDGPEALKGLSFYRERLDINAIYYGDWQYDTVHLRPTVTKDEYTGEEIAEEDAGAQAGFEEDFEAAWEASGTSAEVFDVL
ncbi:Nn.00g030290.m01.CDS01 [Neocucurbitaria sp. VM-36]